MEKEDSAPKVCLIASEDAVIDEEAVSELARAFLTKSHMEPARSAGGCVTDEPGGEGGGGGRTVISLQCKLQVCTNPHGTYEQG